MVLFLNVFEAVSVLCNTVSDRYVMHVEVTQFPWLHCKYEDLGACCETAPPS